MNESFVGMPMADYRAAEGLANSELQQFKRDPASYVWAKNAPRDPKKSATADFGTAIHCALLEPSEYDGLVIVADVKGKNTKRFLELQLDNPSKCVLTEDEAEQIKVLAMSANAHPVFSAILAAKGDCELSVFVDDEVRGIKLKCRPDKIIEVDGLPPLPVDVKTTDDISKWRKGLQWANPLYDFEYGFTAAYYLHVLSIHYGVELQEYAFAVQQKSAELGSYPATVFTITKRELIDLGFWDDAQSSLDDFAECQRAGNFMSVERFPDFGDNAIIGESSLLNYLEVK